MRGRLLLIATLAGASVAGCGGASTPAAAPRVARVHVALPAGPRPSKSAKMVCAPKARTELANVLGEDTTQPLAPTWADHLYSCHYVYPDGVMTLSVKELSSRAETTAYFTMLEAQMGNTGNLNGLGQGAFSTRNGSVVARKDYKVLLVDVSGLPAQFGVPATSSGDVAISVADTIMGCWSGA